MTTARFPSGTPLSEAPLSEMSFGDPWTARLFGVTLALSEAGRFSLQDFQAALTAAVGGFEERGRIEDEADYYTRWLEALTALLSASGDLDDRSLTESERIVAARLLDLQRHRHDHHARPPSEAGATARRKIEPLVVA